MPDILVYAAEAYRAKLTATLAGSRSEESLRRYFPGLSETDQDKLRELVRGLDRLVPELCAFVCDRDQVLADRALAASALSYLIMPFDIVPDEEGLAGLADDAVVAFRLASALASPTAALRETTQQYAPFVAMLQDAFPEWLTEAVERTVAVSLTQPGV